MVFYASLRLAGSYTVGRYLAIAPSFEVLDEWWRVMSENNLGYKRISPEWYTYPAALVPINTTLPGAKAVQFVDKIIFNIQSDWNGLVNNTFPSQVFTDHISGNTYFIRSKSDRSLYWYVNDNAAGKPSGNVFVSRQGRTKFLIQSTDRELFGKVLIRADAVQVYVAGSDVAVGPGSDNVMIAGGHAHSHTFGSLLSGTYLAKGAHPNVGLLESPHGEDWELVQ